MRKQMQVRLPPLRRCRAERGVLRRVGDQVVLLTIRVMAVARPRPIAGGTDEAGPNRIEISVPHHLELPPAILNARRAQALHDDLSAAHGPPVVPTGKP